MKIEKFQLRGNNSVYAGAFQLMSGRALAQLRGKLQESRLLHDFRSTGRHLLGAPFVTILKSNLRTAVTVQNTT
jgi:hypothetical protein